MSEALEPPPPLDIPAWATENIVFGKDSPLPGRYDHKRFPYWRRVLEVMSPEHPVPEVVLCKSAQVGGTVAADTAIGAVLDLAPCPIFYVTPNAGNAGKWMRGKFRPMVAGSARLNGIMKPPGSKEGYSLKFWERRDGTGSIQLGAAESPADLSMASYPYQVQDDLSKWPDDNGAGSPLTQADSRTSAFMAYGGKLIRISTPLVWPGCLITQAYRRGTQEKYHIVCPRCRTRQVLEWENMLEVTNPERPDSARFVCIHCGGDIEDRQKTWIMDPANGAGWVAENPAAASHCVSFHIWAAYSHLKTWEQMYREWLSSKGNPLKEQVFANDWLGQAYETAEAAPEWQALKDRAEAANIPRGVVPPRHPLLVVGVDCQVDRIEAQTVAYGPDTRRHVVDYDVIDEPIFERQGGERLAALLDRAVFDPFGNERLPMLMVVDANTWTTDVMAWHRALPKDKRGRVILVRGVSGDSKPPLDRVKFERNAQGKIIRARQTWFNVGVSPLKWSLYAALRKTDPLEPGYIGFAAGLPDSYFEGLTSEVRKRLKVAGQDTYRWELLPGLRNEPLDTMNYSFAGYVRLQGLVMPPPRWEQLINEADVERPGQSDLFGAAARVQMRAAKAPAPGQAADAGEAAPERPVKTRPSWQERLAEMNKG